MNLLDDLKEYLRIDGDDENSSLSSFITAAQIYLSNAGVQLPTEYYQIVEGKDIYAQHRLAIHMLSAHYYESRLIVGQKNEVVPYGLQSIILQLKLVKIDESSSV